jgi:hypothetical protein
MIPRAGHVPMMERHEEFNQALEAFAVETLGGRKRRRTRPARKDPA